MTLAHGRDNDSVWVVLVTSSPEFAQAVMITPIAPDADAAAMSKTMVG